MSIGPRPKDERRRGAARGVRVFGSWPRTAARGLGSRFWRLGYIGIMENEMETTTL